MAERGQSKDRSSKNSKPSGKASSGNPSTGKSSSGNPRNNRESSGNPRTNKQASGNQPSSNPRTSRQPTNRPLSAKQPTAKQPTAKLLTKNSQTAKPLVEMAAAKRPPASDRATNTANRRSNQESNRWLGLFSFFLLAAVVIFVRLFYIQVYAADDLAARAEEQRQVPQAAVAQRGTIYDRNGLVLAISVDTVSIYVNTLQMDDPAATAYCLAKALGGNADDYLARISDPPAGATNVCLVRFGDLKLEQDLVNYQANLERYILPVDRLKAQLDPAVGQIWFTTTPLSCLNYVHEYKRIYPYGSIGAQVIGNVNSDNQGISGIELQYNNILAGQNGVIIQEQGRDGTPLPNGSRIEQPKIDGENIIISIDIDLQEYVESELVTYAELGSVSAGSVMLVDGASGEIYAAASLPLYDRENLTEADIIAGAMSLGCIVTPYEPGSTMKAVTAAAALEAGVINTEEVLYIPSRLGVDSYQIKDWYEHSDLDMNLRDILAKSSNIGITLIGQRLGKQGLYDYFYQAGFYQPTHVDYLGLDGVGEPLYVTDSIDPLTGDYLSIADKPELWSNILMANLTFGQGLHVTPLQIASFYGAVNNDGVRTDPHFLISRPQSSSELQYRSTRIMSSETATTLNDLLESVMTDGTGQAGQVAGYRMAGKTGTAEIASPQGGYSDEVCHSIVGYFVDCDIDLVCIVTMDNSQPVGDTVASKPLFSSVMEYVANRYRIAPNALTNEVGE